MLTLGEDELKQDEELMPIYKHPKQFDEGLGLERAGKSYVVVSQDGSGDCDNLREAYTQLNKNGGKIFIKDGTYILKSTLPLYKNNVTIEGSGSSSIIQGTNKNPLIKISGANIKISNCYIKDDSGVITTGTRLIDISGSNLIKIDKCFFSGYDRAVWLRGNSTECTLSNNQINTSNAGAGYGFYVSNSDRNIIENNVINNTAPENGIYLDTGSDFNLISKNSFTGQDTMLNGIWIAAGDNNIISENMVQHFTEYGIYIATGCNNNVVTSNFLTVNYGVQFLNSGANTQIAHNVIV
ncbi:pectinesterase family protein [Candidatus Dojkabacteria bacterium]|jgi:parallel beta-helix repeat protein|nr:pectinesterase family protein [Candidatus Dojkabacteria bacterium]